VVILIHDRAEMEKFVKPRCPVKYDLKQTDHRDAIAR
jgi:hypothetical protein